MPLNNELNNKDINDVKDAITRLEAIGDELKAIKSRLNTLDKPTSKYMPLTHLTPSSDLNDVKRVLNYIVNYMNEGVDRGSRSKQE